MNRPASPEYHTKILGRITAEQRDSLGYFFENKNLERLDKVWPSNLRTSPSFSDVKDPKTVLESLNPLIEELALSNLFKRDTTNTPRLLPAPYSEAWAMFVTSVTQTLGRAHLHRIGELPEDAKIISQNELRRALKHNPYPKLEVRSNEFTLQHHGQRTPYGIPHDLVMTTSQAGFGLDIAQAVDYYPAAPINPSNRVNLLKSALTLKVPQKFLRHALGDILNIDPGWIFLPRKDEPAPKFRMVIASEPQQTESTPTSTPYGGEPTVVGAPNVEVMAVWLLRILTDKIPRESDWRNYFKQIS